MYIYDVPITKLNTFLLPQMSETLTQCFNSGLYTVCKNIDGEMFDTNKNTNCYKLLNLFVDLKDDDIDSYKTFYLLIHNTKHMMEINGLNAGTTFINNLNDFLIENGHSVMNVYIFMIDKYYTAYYLQKFKYYQDIKNVNINNKNLVSFALSSNNIFTTSTITELDFQNLYAEYSVYPNISYALTPGSYKSYRLAEEDYINIVQEYVNNVTDNPIPACVSTTSDITDPVLKQYLLDIFELITLNTNKFKKILYKSEFAFLNSLQFNPQFISDFDMNKSFSIILKGWYNQASIEDYFLTLIDFVEFLFSDLFVKTKSMQYEEITFDNTFNITNLLEYYYFKIYNSDKNLYIGNDEEYSRIRQTSDPKNYINLIQTEIVLSEIEERFLNTTHIKTKLAQKRLYFDALQSYFRLLYTHVKKELKQ